MIKGVILVVGGLLLGLFLLSAWLMFVGYFFGRGFYQAVSEMVDKKED